MVCVRVCVNAQWSWLDITTYQSRGQEHREQGARNITFRFQLNSISLLLQKNYEYINICEKKCLLFFSCAVHCIQHAAYTLTGPGFALEVRDIMACELWKVEQTIFWFNNKSNNNIAKYALNWMVWRMAINKMPKQPKTFMQMTGYDQNNNNNIWGKHKSFIES